MTPGKFLLLCLCAFLAGLAATAQPDSTPYRISLLKDDSKYQVLSSFSVYQNMEQHDSNTIIRLIAAMEKATATASPRVQARVLALKSRLLFYYLVPGDSLYATLMKDALSKAYALNDPYMIAEYTRWYGEMLNTLHNRPLAAQYCMNALKMQQELGFQYFPTIKTLYLTTAEMLYRTMNYPTAIGYYRYALTLPDDSLNPKRYKEFKEYQAHCMNAYALSYTYLKQYDSAVFFLEKCMRYVQANQLPEDLYYIASDNRFDPLLELHQYDSCIKIANDLYVAGQPADSGTLLAACFMKGRIALRTGNPDEALKWSLQAEQYGLPTPKNLFQVYKDLAAACEQLGQKDKALVYYKKWQALEQANSEMRRKTDAAFLEAESEFQRSKLMLGRINADRTQQVSARNFLIAGVSLLAFISIIYFYLRRKKAEKARMAAEEKFHFFQTQYQSAEEQLAMFKNEVAAKNLHIEQLQAEKENHSSTRTDIKQIDALSRQIILTEGDWELFKQSFDAVYPGFYTTLRQTIPGITNAEARMACLIKLNFDAKHIAGMLGISPSSVSKTRYRLKKRFKNEEDESLEDIIGKI